MENQVISIIVNFEDMTVGVEEFEFLEDYFYEGYETSVECQVHKNDIDKTVDDNFKQFGQNEKVTKCKNMVRDILRKVDEDKYVIFVDQDDDQVTYCCMVRDIVEEV